MSRHPLEARIRELHDARFKEYEEELLHRKAIDDRAAKGEPGREKKRREFLECIGVDLKRFDAERQKDDRAQQKALQDFLDEQRPAAVDRPSRQASDARQAALRTAVLAEAGQLVLPPYAATLYRPNRAAFDDVKGEFGNGAIDSGWVFPDDPGRIRLKESGHVGAVCFEAVASPPDPEFAVHFGFIPARTASFEMTAVLAFHGFYVLRSDDSWWNCRHAEATLKVRMNVHQYVDLGWKSFPALIDRHESNVEEVTPYDRTHFLDYTAVLKGGDPVVVTVSGSLHAIGIGGGTYAELNFEAGTANYIQPLLLSVQQV